MLPAASRLRQRSDFTTTMRSGRRAARPRLIVHLALPDSNLLDGSVAPAAGPRAGFVVGRQVGGAVVRNRVRRQLQHLSADRLSQLPPGARLVVRALPAAAGSSGHELAADLDAAIARTLAGPNQLRGDGR